MEWAYSFRKVPLSVCYITIFPAKKKNNNNWQTLNFSFFSTQVFISTVKWLKYDWLHRKGYAYPLLQKVWCIEFAIVGIISCHYKLSRSV